jgi:hypothetical protein
MNAMLPIGLLIKVILFQHLEMKDPSGNDDETEEKEA